MAAQTQPDSTQGGPERVMHRIEMDVPRRGKGKRKRWIWMGAGALLLIVTTVALARLQPAALDQSTPPCRFASAPDPA